MTLEVTSMVLGNMSLSPWITEHLIYICQSWQVMEFMSSTPKVLQTAFTGGVLHFGITTLNVLNLVEWVAAMSLLWNVQPIRSTLNKMPAWNVVGRRMRMTLRQK